MECDKVLMCLGWDLRQWGLAAYRMKWAIPGTIGDALRNRTEYLSQYECDPGIVEIAKVAYGQNWAYVERLIDIAHAYIGTPGDPMELVKRRYHDQSRVYLRPDGSCGLGQS